MKYRRKPVEIEAIQWTGTNRIECARFVHGDKLRERAKENDISLYPGDVFMWWAGHPHLSNPELQPHISDLRMVDRGNWLVREADGRIRVELEFYFRNEYEAIGQANANANDTG